MEVREVGECGHCHKPVLKIVNSDSSTCRTDGVRYAYPETVGNGWGIFRCNSCLEVISDTWEAIVPPTLLLEAQNSLNNSHNRKDSGNE